MGRLKTQTCSNRAIRNQFCNYHPGRRIATRDPQVPRRGGGFEPGSVTPLARLGFEVDWRWPDERPTHAGLMLGETSIMLSHCDPVVCADIYFIVDDVEACHAAIISGRAWEVAAEAAALVHRDSGPVAAALEPPKSPAETGYGLRDFSLVDPWGNHMSFGQELGDC